MGPVENYHRQIRLIYWWNYNLLFHPFLKNAVCLHHYKYHYYYYYYIIISIIMYCQSPGRAFWPISQLVWCTQVTYLISQWKKTPTYLSSSLSLHPFWHDSLGFSKSVGQSVNQLTLPVVCYSAPESSRLLCDRRRDGARAYHTHGMSGYMQVEFICGLSLTYAQTTHHRLPNHFTVTRVMSKSNFVIMLQGSSDPKWPNRLHCNDFTHPLYTNATCNAIKVGL